MSSPFVLPAEIQEGWPSCGLVTGRSKSQNSPLLCGERQDPACWNQAEGCGPHLSLVSSAHFHPSLDPGGAVQVSRSWPRVVPSSPASVHKVPCPWVLCLRPEAPSWGWAEGSAGLSESGLGSSSQSEFLVPKLLPVICPCPLSSPGLLLLASHTTTVPGAQCLREVEG